MINNSDLSRHTTRAKSAQGRHESVAEIETRHGRTFPFTLAAPSMVIPAGVAENSHFLAAYFPEICLLFFETEACLNYTARDLSTDLTTLPVSWHLHFPLDLPWAHGLDAVWDKLVRLMDTVAYLAPRVWVLHPPTVPDMLVPLAARFRDAGIDPTTILLENVEDSDLTALWGEARAGGYSTCLDLGHILAYDQLPVLDLPGLWETVRMLHIYAPGNNGRHTPLCNLDETGKTLLRSMLEKFNGDTVTLEVFEESGLFESADLLAHWISEWSANK